MQTMAQLNKNAMVRAGRGMNTCLDVMFYDVNALTPEEKGGLFPSANPEGSILIVHPKTHGQDILTFTPMEFISLQRQKESTLIETIIVAGVGSSALGTAAFARNVADYSGRPVAGIVSGLGIADVVSEALGGWFVLGLKNSIRDAFAKMFDALELKDHVWDDSSYRSLVKDRDISHFDVDRFVFGSPDSLALLLVLYHLNSRIKLLVGHSKGNYVIENALEGLVSLCTLNNQDIPRTLQVVTLGAVIRFSEHFPNVTQFMGGMDLFGMLNSRPELKPEYIPGSWHTLNTSLPGHISVGEALKKTGVKPS